MARTAHLLAALAALSGAGAAGRAEALSCLRPTVEASVSAAQAAEERYRLVVGRIVPAEGASVPAPVGPNEREDMTLPARVEGRALVQGGFVAPVDLPVTVTLTCAGPWCGGLPEGEALLFLVEGPEGLTLTEGPCPFNVLGVEPDTEARVLACLAGDCTPPE